MIRMSNPNEATLRLSSMELINHKNVDDNPFEQAANFEESSPEE